jgi:hypothetical protein
MSLKSFHLVFIVASIALAGFFTAWAFNDYQMSDAASSLVMAIGGALATAVLCGYFGWVVRKLKSYSYLAIPVALSLLYSNGAWACATCFGNPSSPMVKAANAGVLFLLVVVSTVLVAFAGLFIHWFRKTEKLDRAANGL